MYAVSIQSYVIWAHSKISESLIRLWHPKSRRCCLLEAEYRRWYRTFNMPKGSSACVTQATVCVSVLSKGWRILYVNFMVSWIFIFFCFRSVGFDELEYSCVEYFDNVVFATHWQPWGICVPYARTLDMGRYMAHTHLDINSTPSHFGLSCYLGTVWKFTFNQVRIW